MTDRLEGYSSKGLRKFIEEAGAKKVTLVTDTQTWRDHVDTLRAQLVFLGIQSNEELSYRFVSKITQNKLYEKPTMEVVTEPRGFLGHQRDNEAILYVPGCLCCIGLNQDSPRFNTLKNKNLLYSFEKGKIGIALPHHGGLNYYSNPAVTFLDEVLEHVFGEEKKSEPEFTKKIPFVTFPYVQGQKEVDYNL